MATELVVETVNDAPHFGSGSRDDTGDVAERIDLFGALAKLSSFDRAVVVLRYWDDLSVEAVATALGCSAGAVRNRSMRALHRLRLHLATSTGSGSATSRSRSASYPTGDRS